jgi:hypothetical protein
VFLVEATKPVDDAPAGPPGAGCRVSSRNRQPVRGYRRRRKWCAAKATRVGPGESHDGVRDRSAARAHPEPTDDRNVLAKRNH